MKQPTTDGVRYILAWLQAIFFTLLFSNIVWLPYAHAGPEGGTVTGGSGSINQSGNQTTVYQNTQNMAIDWQSYNLGSNESIQYIQPNSSSISLNRILSNSGSVIQGRIDANGQVILVNPNGIFFTSTAVINVGSIIASGLDIQPSDFMNGNYIFSAVLGTEGKVVNSGLITASTGGNVTLLGKQVKNDGLITAKLGSVNLAVGKEAVLTFDNAGLIGIGISKAILQDELGIDPAVLNSGTINAEGGQVLLTASVSRDIFSQVLNIDSIQATSVVVHDDGSFTLGAGADVVNTGTIDVSTTRASANEPSVMRIVLLGENVTSSGTLKADNVDGDGGEIELHARETSLLTENSLTSARSEANGKGGIIKILGDKVGLLGQTIVDVSGANGGGMALIGGDYRGENSRITNASGTYVGKDTLIAADALDNGDGGKVIVWGNDSTKVYGRINARGGQNGGNGGFVETSAAIVDLDPLVNVSTVSGSSGIWLIDPDNIEIFDDGNSANDSADISLAGSRFTSTAGTSYLDNDALLSALDNNGVTVIVQTTDSAGLPEIDPNNSAITNGNITISGDLNLDSIDLDIFSTTPTLELRAHHDININAQIHDSKNDNDTLNIKLLADYNGVDGGDVNFNASVDTYGGTLEAQGVNINVNSGGAINTWGGSVTLTATGSVSVADSITTGNGTLITESDSFNHTAGTINTGDGNITLNGLSTTGTFVLGNVQTNNNLTIQNKDQATDINVGAISQTTLTSLSIAGDTKLKSSSTVVLNNDNDFDAVYVDAVSALLHDTGKIKLGTSTLTGTGAAFTISTANGDIEQLANSIITVSGNSANVKLTANGNNGDIIQGSNSSLINNGTGSLTTLIATGDTITLDSTGNDFTRVTADADNITLHDADDIVLGAFSNNKNDSRLTVTTVNGSITQAAQINYVGDNVIIKFTAGGTGSDIIQNNNVNLINDGSGSLTDLTAADDITLAASTNDFTRVSVNSMTAKLVDVDVIDLGASSVTGDYSVTSGVINGIKQFAGLTVGGQATFTLVGGANSDITLDNTSNNFNNISIVASAGSINDVTVTDTNGLALDALTITGDLTINANAGGGTGSVTDNGAIVVAGLTDINAGAGSVVLDTLTNNFGQVDIYAASAILVEAGNIELGEVAITGSGTSLQVTALGAGNISQTPGTKIENINGTTILAAGNDITLLNPDNDFGTLSITQAATADIFDTNSINLGTTTIGTSLDITSGGNITNTGGAITLLNNAIGTFTVANNGSISLDNTGNRFSQPINLVSLGSTLNTVDIFNLLNAQINLTDIISGDLDIISSGSINSNSVFDVGGTTTLSATGQNITLTNAANDFTILNVLAANDVDIRDSNAIEIGSITANTVHVEADDIALGLVRARTTTLTARSGQIRDNNNDALNIVGDTATLSATQGVGVGDPLETQLTSLTIANGTGEIGIHNTGDVTVNMATTGDINFTNVGDVHIDLLDGIAGSDTHSAIELTVVNGSVFGALPLIKPDIRGHDVTVIVNDGAGDFGEAGRPIYLDVHGVFAVLANISAYDFYLNVPSDIIDNSSIKLSISSLFSLISGQKLIEIESLGDLDPAIFTEVRNYYHDDLAIMMPLDQMYSEEEEEERRRKMSER